MAYKANAQKTYYIYKYTSPSGKYYIGRSCNPKNIRAKWDGSGYRMCSAFWRAIEKYGWESFEYEVLEENIAFEKIDERENYWIDYYHSSTDENGYNLLKPCSQTGKTYTSETRKKLSLSHLHKLEEVSAGTISDAEKPRFRFRPRTSEETKAKLREKCNCSHAVAQYDFDGNYIQTFASRTEAAKAVGVTKNSINNCCIGKIKSCGGFQWRNASGEVIYKIEPYIDARFREKVVS